MHMHTKRYIYLTLNAAAALSEPDLGALAMTRVLIVTVTKPGSSRRPAEDFIKFVKESFRAQIKAHEKLEFLIRSHTELQEFLPPAPPPDGDPDIAASKYCIAALDGLDFVFMDGDEQLLPWVPVAAPLLKLLHLCTIARKCVFACGCAVPLLVYLSQIGPIQIPVLNNGGVGGALDEFRMSTKVSYDAAANPTGVMLDNRTGDMFRMDPTSGVWTPVGNVGMHCSFGKITGSKQDHPQSEINRSDGVGSVEVTRVARYHFLFKGIFPHKFLVPQRNQWHCHLPECIELPLPTGSTRVKGLARSGLGVQVLEAGNVVALQLRLSERYPNTLKMLRNFVEEKMALHGGPDGPKGINELTAMDKNFADLFQMVRGHCPPPPPPPPPPRHRHLRLHHLHPRLHPRLCPRRSTHSRARVPRARAAAGRAPRRQRRRGSVRRRRYARHAWQRSRARSRESRPEFTRDHVTCL